MNYDISRVKDGVAEPVVFTLENIGIFHNILIFNQLKRIQDAGYPITKESQTHFLLKSLEYSLSKGFINQQSFEEAADMIQSLDRLIEEPNLINECVELCKAYFERVKRNPDISNDFGMTIFSIAYYSSLFWSQVIPSVQPDGFWKRFLGILKADIEGAAAGAAVGSLFGGVGGFVGAGAGGAIGSTYEALQ